MFKEITKDNWLLFAQQHYDNPTLEKEVEFFDDITLSELVVRNIEAAIPTIQLWG